MQYTALVIEHFAHPRNVGDIENPDGRGEVGSAVCGDMMRVTIKVVDSRISELKFKTFGCAASIASGSMMTEIVKGKTIEEVIELTNQEVAAALGGLPPVKMHCSCLAADALRAAIEDYLNKQ
jgi:nitrogen fixation NifU-like protein